MNDDKKVNDAATVTKDALVQLQTKLLSDKTFADQIKDESIAWALLNGLVVGGAPAQGYGYPPFTLFGQFMTKSEFKELCQVSLIFHKLVDKVARNDEFLIKCVESAATGDPDFTGKMLKLYKKQMSNKEKYFKQKYYLGIFRSDYMRNDIKTDKNNINNIDNIDNSGTWAQIELNTISVALAGLSDKVNNMHRFILDRYFGINKNKIEELDISNINITESQSIKTETNTNIQLIPATTHIRIAKSLAIAARIVHPDEPMVLMVVQEGEKNTSDQKVIEHAMWDSDRVPMMRRSMLQIYKTGKIDENTNDLIIDKKRISVVYYRAGYQPQDYKSGKNEEWSAREMMEFSNAIKCPSIAYHLIGCKIMQTVFSDINNLKLFLTEYESKLLLKHFVSLYSFDPNFVSKDEINNRIELAKESFDSYVLKPQREGGGNNYYGKQIPKKIYQLMTEHSSSNASNTDEKDGSVDESLSSYLLMQRIFPKETDTMIVRDVRDLNSPSMTQAKSISELGIFSAYLSDGSNKAVIDEAIGSLLRTREAQSTESSVLNNVAALDSVVLV